MGEHQDRSGAPERSSRWSWLKQIWVIDRSEVKKFVPLLLLKFFASLVYSILNCMKDTLIVTSAHSGAEVIPILKGSVVFPAAIVCAVIYSSLSNRFKRTTLFYGIVSIFLIVIFVYGFLLYPNYELLSPVHSSDWLLQKLGSGYTHWIAVYRNWPHSFFFVTTELWAQVVILTLYWGFANHILRMGEAKRMYSLFVAAGDIGPLLAGPITLHYTLKYAGDSFVVTLQMLISFALICGGCMLLIYFWMNRYVLTDTRFYDPSQTHHTVAEKTKLSLRKSIRHILSSKYLIAIAILVVSCSLTMTLVEVTWKAYLKHQYPTASSYQMFMSKAIFYTGIISLTTSLLLGSGLIRRFGWLINAQITPIFLGLTGGLFFLICMLKNHLAPLCNLLSITPLTMIVFFGAFQYVVGKSVKYSFFDTTKEYAFIPLDQESKVKGKAAIEIVGSRLGKSSSSWIQVLLMQLGGATSILMITPCLFPLVLGVTAYWTYTNRRLDRALAQKATDPADKIEEKPRPINDPLAPLLDNN